MRYEERSEKPEDRTQNEPKVKPGSTPNIDWPSPLYDRHGWIRNPVEPNIPAKEYALLIVVWAADNPLRWEDITAGIDAHPSRLTDSLRALQGKR